MMMGLEEHRSSQVSDQLFLSVVKTDQRPPNAGSYKVKSQKEYTIHDQECASYMAQIFAKCGGYGGSITTGFGTVSSYEPRYFI